jgi:putative nucleotidyltransferase with HDIG domain
MMNRDEGEHLLKQHIDTESYLLPHSLETEAVMKALAEKLGKDPDLWGLVGLLHDIDFSRTEEEPERHGLVAADILADHDVPDEVIEAIKAHNGENNGTPIESVFHHALRCSETITGLISAAALVQPTKKLASVKPKSVKKKFKDKAFARKVNRDTIRECKQVGVELPEFIEIALRAMQGIAPRVGL